MRQSYSEVWDSRPPRAVDGERRGSAVHTRVMAPFDTLPWGVLNVAGELGVRLDRNGRQSSGIRSRFCTHAVGTRTRNRSVRGLSGVECTELIRSWLLPNVAA